MMLVITDVNKKVSSGTRRLFRGPVLGWTRASLDVIANLDRDDEWALLTWTRAGLDDVFDSGRGVTAGIVILCLNKEIEDRPNKGGAGAGPKFDGGSGKSVDGGR